MRFLKLTLILCCSIVSASLFAQTIELKTNSLNSGGATSNSNSFSLHSTIGTIGGTVSSNTYQLNAGFQSGAASAASEPGLIAHYPFDGNLDDISGNMYHATFSSTQEYTPDVAGLPNRAYYFDGFETQVYHNLATPVNFSAITLSAWVYIQNPTEVTGDYEHIVGLESGTQFIQMARIDGTYVLFHNNGAEGADSYGIGTFGVVSEGWHQVAITWDGINIVAYVDGVSVATDASTFNLSFDVSSFTIGRNFYYLNNFSGEPLEGAIDEVRIYNYALTGEEISSLYEAFPPAPAAPQNFTAKVVAPGGVRLTWDDGPDETYYYVYWYDNLFNPIGEQELAGDVTSFNVTGLTPGIEHYFEVWSGNYVKAGGFSSVFATPVELQTPIVESSIPLFTLDEAITLTYYPDRSYPAGDLVGAGQVNMYAGLIAPENVGSGIWSHPVGPIAMGYDVGLDVWTVTITPRSFFGASASFSAAQLAMNFENGDGTLFGRAPGGQNIKLQVFDDKNIGPIGPFIPTTIETDIFIEDAGTSTTVPANIQIENMASFTLEALVNFDQDPPGSGLFFNLIGRRVFDDLEDKFLTRHGLVYYDNGTVSAPASYAIGTDFYYLSESTIPYTRNTWTHMALVKDGSNIGLYVNGHFQHALVIEEALLGATELQMGSFQGGLDEVRIWNYARNGQELRGAMKSQVNPDNHPGLVAYWPMNQINTVGTDNITPDMTGNGNPLIVVDAVVEDLPDLEIASFVAPSALAPDEAINIDYTIENTGLGDAGLHRIGLYFSTNAVLDINDELLNFIDINELLAGNTTSGSLSGTIPGVTTGNYYVILAADINLEVEETDETNNYLVSLINIDPANANTDPSGIFLSNANFAENLPVGSAIGTLTAEDPDNDLFTYTLHAGTGADHNHLFSINGDQLITNAEFNFEAGTTTFFVRVQVSDNRGGQPWSGFFTLTLLDVNEAPTSLTFEGGSTTINLAEGTYPAGVGVGFLEVADEDIGDSHSFAITQNDGGDFQVENGNQLVAYGSFSPSTKSEYHITISATDGAENTITEDFLITIVPVGIPPSGILLSNNIINVSHGGGAFIGQFSTIDEDSDQHTYALVNNSDGKFSVGSNDGRLVQTDDIPEGEYAIMVTSTDDIGLSLDRGFTIFVVSNEVPANSVIKVGEQVGDYRIVGVPFQNAPISGIFDGLGEQRTDWRILRYNTSNSTVSDLDRDDNMTGGVGYWFLSKNAVTIVLGARDLNNGATFSKNLSQGWNLIANPFLSPLDWNAVVAYNIAEGIIGSTDLRDNIVYTHNGGFNNSSDLAIMEGGFVYAENPVTLLIPSSTQTEGSGSRISLSNKVSQSYYDQADEWQLFFDLSSGSKTTNISAIGISKEATDMEDHMDMSAPPSFQLPFQLTEKATGLTKNLKPDAKTVIWDYLLTGADEMTTITWDQHFTGYLDKPLMLALLPQGHVIDIRAMGEITFLPEENQSVIFIYGTELPQELLSGSISAYPNPVDKEVSFRYYVDGEGIVETSVEIFNLSGQQLGAIRQNVTGSTWADVRYNVAVEETLKSGVYLFKVKFHDFESAAKKLIVK